MSPRVPLSRSQLLHELGLSPQWQLRVDPPVLRRAGLPVGATSPPPEPSPPRSIARSAPPAAAAPASTPAGPAVAPQAAPAPPPGQAPQVPQSALPAALASDSADAAANTRAPEAAAPAERAERIARLGWDELRASVAECRACELCRQRRQAVFGVGDSAADWLFVGEGPGAEEDARGEPFVGPAGKLLDAMLAAIDLERGRDVFIANAVKCRPPANRTPVSAEIAACAPYLQRQIALLRPRVIVALGLAATRALLGEGGTLGSLRGQQLAYAPPDGTQDAIPVVVTYHPAYLLRTLPDKAKAWEDLCRARALMRSAKAAADGAPAP